MKFETIGRVTMSDHTLKVGWQVDNCYGTERTFLWADTTTNAEALRNKSNF
jgi:hypothetical protein